MLVVTFVRGSRLWRGSVSLHFVETLFGVIVVAATVAVRAVFSVLRSVLDCSVDVCMAYVAVAWGRRPRW